MNEIANNPLEKRNKEHNENLKVEKTWKQGLNEPKEYDHLGIMR